MYDFPEKNLLDFLHGLYTPRGGHELVEYVLRRISDVIGCHNRGIARYDPVRRTILQMNLDTPFTSRAFLDSVRDGGDMAPESFWQMRPEARHPVHIVSQMFSRHQWDNHPMYRDMFRSEGIVDCMTLEFGDAARRFMFCLHRDRRGFKPAEIETIRILAPHLEQAFANSRIFETAIPRLDAKHLPGNARIHHLGPIGESASRRIIRENRPRWISMLGHEPALAFDDLDAWIHAGLAHLAHGATESIIPPFNLHGGGGTLRFRLMRHWGGEGHLLAEESVPRWHLTTREQEILHWVRAGKTDREIAAILDLSHHTVREHLRRIYRKSGTHTRTAAARLVPNPGDTAFP